MADAYHANVYLSYREIPRSLGGHAFMPAEVVGALPLQKT